MGELTLHSVQKGVTRLLAMPRDLPEAWARPERPIEPGAASDAHRHLFQNYSAELKRVVPIAMDWWKGRLTALEAREPLDRRSALDRLYHETPAGPASAREVVSVVRDFWLACEQLNPTVPEAQRVPPEVFLISWVRDEDALEVLSGMLYWPIGLDADGHWV